MQTAVTQIEGIQNALIGSSYSHFAVGTGFDFHFDEFVLSAQDIVSCDETALNACLLSAYQPAGYSANPECIAKSVIAATCLGISVSSVELLADSSLLVEFSNNVVVRLPTDTPGVDWHWAFTETGGDPYLGSLIGCFAPGDVQGSMGEFAHQRRHASNWSFKPNPRSPISGQTRCSSSANLRPTRRGSA